MRWISILTVTITLGGVLMSARPTEAAQAENPATAAASPAVQAEVHSGEGWAIAAPEDWNVLPAARTPMVVYLVGDGKEGVPLMDGTLSPMKAGLLVEVFPKGGQSLKQRIDKDARELKESGKFQLQDEPQWVEITLADGTKATAQRANFLRKENGRLSFYRRNYCQDEKGRHVVATGFITCSPAGASFVKAIGLATFVQAHVDSLVLDRAKLDRAKLKAAYDKHLWTADDALALTSKGNRLLEKPDYAGAAKVFREAIARCEHVSAAHNGLAWALLNAGDVQQKDLEEALAEAQKAVELTEQRDPSSLDTLALALQRHGEKAKALETIRKALTIDPRNRELQKRLESIEAGE